MFGQPPMLNDPLRSGVAQVILEALPPLGGIQLQPQISSAGEKLVSESFHYDSVQARVSFGFDVKMTLDTVGFCDFSSNFVYFKIVLLEI